MAYLRGEPVPNTCPDIDSMKAAIADIAENLDLQINSDNEDGIDRDVIRYSVYGLIELIDGNSSVLEKLRDANSQLRQWGNDMREIAEDYESKIADLESELELSEEIISKLQGVIEDAVNITEEL